MRLLDQQTEFFRSLAEDGETPAEVRGRIGIYRYAYFERIRASIEEDFPELFEYLAAVDAIPGGIDAETVTRELLEHHHPKSWTLAEASLPVIAALESLLAAPVPEPIRMEAVRLAREDEADALASWLEEWPDATVALKDRVATFASGGLRLARTRTWRVAGDRIFWRSDSGVQCADAESFREFEGLFPLVETPVGFAAFAETASEAAVPEAITDFLRRGVSEGWLRFVAAET